MCSNLCDSIVVSLGFADALSVPSLCSPDMDELCTDVGGQVGASLGAKDFVLEAVPMP